MRVAVVLDHRFEQTPDGRVWTNGPFPYSFFERYLEVFDEVLVAARVQPVERLPDQRKPVSGAGVSVAGLPCYRTTLDYLGMRGELLARLEAALEPEAAVILRVPSQAGILATSVLERQGRCYAVEVVGDPRDAFAPGAYPHPLRPVLRWKHAFALARLCRRAAASAYVTKRALQRRYPPGPGRPTTHYSSVELGDEAFVSAPPAQPRTARRIISVGSMEHLYKGFDTLIEAVAACRRGGFDLDLELVGDGRFRPRLEALTADLGVADGVRFSGQAASGEAVRERLDHADLFVLLSRQEGLPRALIEAQARGLPAVATRVGGIPELLPAGLLLEPNDPDAAARLIRAVAADPALRARTSALALATARRYHDSRLAPRRRELYRWALRLTPGVKDSPAAADRTTAEHYPGEPCLETTIERRS